jgi:hypothetical protein
MDRMFVGLIGLGGLLDPVAGRRRRRDTLVF